MEFSRQEYWSGLPFPPPGNLTDPGIKLESPASPVLAGGFLTTEPLGARTNKGNLEIIYLYFQIWLITVRRPRVIKWLSSWLMLDPKGEGIFMILDTELFFFSAVLSQSCPTLCTPRTVARQAPLSMGILHTRILEGLPCSPPGFFYRLDAK